MVLQCGDVVAALCHLVSPFHAVEQVLAQFQDRFFHEVDTASIILDLVQRSIIDGGDVEAIMRENDQNLKNEILYHSLRPKCTKDTLMDVCNVIVAVQDNPVMKSLGDDMKSVLERGRCWVWLSVGLTL